MSQGRRPPRRELPRYEVIQAMARSYDAPARAVHAFIAMSILHTELDEALASHFARYGLSQSRFVVLMLLWKTEGHQLTPLEIASGVGVRPATVTGLLTGLERDGLIKRRNATDDRRVVTVHLQPKGRLLLEDIMPDHIARISKMMAGLGEAELESLTGILTLLRDRLDVLRHP